MTEELKIIDLILNENPELYRQLRKELKHEMKIEFNRELKEKRSDIDLLKRQRNSMLKQLTNKYEFNDEAINELRRVAGLKNGITKGYSLNRTSDKLINWSAKFAEEYNGRIEGYNDYSDRLLKIEETTPNDWKYELYYTAVDYAQELTRDLVKEMKKIMKVEYEIVLYVCEDE